MKKSELRQIIKEEITSISVNESINNWKRGNPKKEGYYAIIFDPKNLMGGQDIPNIAYYDGSKWGSNSRGINEPIEFWFPIPDFRR
jgi:hypothetical protein